MRQRDGNAIARIERQISDMGEIKPLGRDRACNNLNLFDPVAHGGDRHARKQHAQRLGDVLRRHSQRPDAILIDHELQRWRLLVPVEMRIDHLVVCTHNFTDLIGNVAHLLRVGAYDTELHRESDRGTEVEPVDPHARFRKRTIRYRFFNSCLDALARLDILRHNDDLGERFIRQLRVKSEPEARRALTDIGGVGRNIVVAFEQPFSAFDRIERCAERSTRRQAKLKEEFRSF